MLLTKSLRWLTRHPWLVTLFLSLTTIISAWAATQIRFDFAPQSIFAGRDRFVAAANEFKQTFGYDDSVIQVVLKANGNRDVLDPAALNWQVSLAHDLHRLPEVVRVESLGSINTHRLSLSGRLGLETEPLIALPANENTEADVREFLDGSHLVEGVLVGATREVAAILVFFDPKLQSGDEMERIVDRVQDAVRHNPPPDDYEVFLTGQAVLRVDIVRNLQNDQRSLIPLAGLLYLGALMLVFRRISGSLLPLMAVGIGLAWMMAALVATDQAFNLVSNVLPMLLLVLGISNSVHVISRYAEESRGPLSRREAVEKTMRLMAMACALTFLTTIAGFASLGTAHSDLLRSFGWQAALGLVLLYFAIIITLTTFLPWLRPPLSDTRLAGRSVSLQPFLNAVDYCAIGHPRWTVALSFLLIGFAVFAARGVKVNSYTIETYDPSHPTIRGIRLVENRLSGLLPLEIDLRADTPERFYQADVVRKLIEVQRFAADQPAVVFERSYLNLHAEVEPALLQLLGEETPPPVEDLQTRIDRSSVRLRRNAEEMGYSAFMTPDKQRARLLLKVRDVGSHDTRELIQALETKLQAAFPKGGGITFNLTGDAYVAAVAMDQLIRDLMTSLLTASAIIFAIITVLFQSLRFGLLAALPNVTPLVLTWGYVGWRGYDMNAGNVIVFTISLGIAVDDTIHFLYRFREERARHPNAVAAAKAALNGTGPAMVLTSLLIVGGLAILLFSSFVPTRRFAELLIVTMFGALLGDLLLLPACLVLFPGKPPSPQGTLEDEISTASEPLAAAQS